MRGYLNALAFPILLLLILTAVALNVMLGGTDIPTAKVWHALIGIGERYENIVVWKLRIPRMIAAALAGAALGLSGYIMQTILRNPLASPELTGVTMGASLSVVIAIVFFPAITPLAHPPIALVGGFLCGGFVLLVSLHKEAGQLGLILAGVAVTALCAACLMLILTGYAPMSQPAYQWLIGSLAGRGMIQLQAMAPWVVLGIVIASFSYRPLLLLSLGEDVAQTAGVDVRRWRSLLLFAALSMTAGVVAVAGPIAFVGLTAPHLARLCLSSQRAICVVSPIIGAAMMLWADLFAKTLATPREIPLGLFLSLIGAPLLIYLIRRSDQMVEPASGAIE